MLKILVGALAVLGIAFVGLSVFGNLYGGGCTFTRSDQAVQSIGGEYYVEFQQTICGDASKSRAYVVMGRLNSDALVAVLEVKGTSDVHLTWSGASELIVSLPKAASVRQISSGTGWPRVIQTFRDASDDAA